MTEWEQFMSSAGRVKWYIDKLEREAQERNAQMEELRQKLALYEGHTLVSLTQRQIEVLLAVLSTVSLAATTGVQVAVLDEKVRREIERELRLTLIALQQERRPSKRPEREG